MVKFANILVLLDEVALVLEQEFLLGADLLLPHELLGLLLVLSFSHAINFYSVRSDALRFYDLIS